jgi:hypothetical protein
MLEAIKKLNNKKRLKEIILKSKNLHSTIDNKNEKKMMRLFNKYKKNYSKIIK